MADRALGHDKAGEEIFDLSNDARWQARLEEARALREIALKKKSAEGAPAPRPKPWELDGQAEPPPVALLHEKDGNSRDLADRLEALKKIKSDQRRGHNGPPVAEDQPAAAKIAPPPEPEAQPTLTASKPRRLSNPNSVFDEPTFERSRSRQREEEPVSLLLPESEVDGARPAPSRASRPWLDRNVQEIRTVSKELEAETEEAAEAVVKRKRRLPFGLEAVILAAFVTPFFVNEPAFPRGPEVSPPPTFAVQAELGLPEPFVNWPTISYSSQRFYSFRASADDIIPLQSTRPAKFARTLAPLEPAETGDTAPAVRLPRPLVEAPSADRSAPVLPDAYASFQQDTSGLNFLRLLLRPVRPGARGDVALAATAQ